jgi:hypothetical protein
VRGTVQFLGNTLVEHPYKAGCAARSRSRPREQQAELGDLPSYESGLFKLGGGEKPMVADFSTFSPFATPADLANAVVRPRELAGMLNPVLGAGNSLINGVDQYGQKTNSPYLAALAQLISTAPESQIGTAFLHRGKDQSRRMFPTSPALAGDAGGDPAVADRAGDAAADQHDGGAFGRGA